MNPTHAAPTVVFIARHGQSEWNHLSRITGQSDIALSDKGRVQAEGLARCLVDEPLDAIYTSALRRTVDTAQPTAAAKGLPIVSLPALNEIHMGVLQGRLRDARDPEAQALWQNWQADPWGPGVPGGESFEVLATRAGEALDDILRRSHGQRVLIVGHRATNRVLLGTLLAWPRARWPEIGMRHKYFYRIEMASPPRVTTIALGGGKAGSRTDGFVM